MCTMDFSLFVVRVEKKMNSEVMTTNLDKFFLVIQYSEEQYRGIQFQKHFLYLSQELEM